MTAATAPFPSAQVSIYERALDARDPRFDGIFFVGIITTHIYCRPVCPARVSYTSHRRFFRSAAAAEHAGFRPCLRCRPELAPGRAPVDSISRIARAAAVSIAAGGLNGRSVGELASELDVSERHLRRALEREIGVSPVELAQTHRLLLAKRLLADTNLSMTSVAYASGFQSLRRFNSVFNEQYRMPPSAIRRTNRPGRTSSTGKPEEAPVRLTLAYREPFAWDALLSYLKREAVAGVELIEGRKYSRTVEVDGHRGIVSVEDACDRDRRPSPGPRGSAFKPSVHRVAQTTPTHVNVDVSASLLPALMPLLARLRHLFDLDADPTVIDVHLAQAGLGDLVARTPGLRLPGAVDGFDVALRLLLGARTGIVAEALGEKLGGRMGSPDLLLPDSARIAEAGAARLISLGVPARRAHATHAVARLASEGAIRLRAGSHVGVTRRALMEIAGIGESTATTIAMRALYWPDALAASDRALWRATGTSSASALTKLAERWRPWRGYAALHLQMQDAAQ